MQNEQCYGSEKLGVCEYYRCVCKIGYILFNFKCYEGKNEILCYLKVVELRYFYSVMYLFLS